MILVKTGKSLLGLFLDKMGLEIKFDDHQVRKNPFLEYKKADFIKWIFFHDFGQKLEITPWFGFG